MFSIEDLITLKNFVYQQKVEKNNLLMLYQSHV